MKKILFILTIIGISIIAICSWGVLNTFIFIATIRTYIEKMKTYFKAHSNILILWLYLIAIFGILTVTLITLYERKIDLDKEEIQMERQAEQLTSSIDISPTIRAIRLLYATIKIETPNCDTCALNDTANFIPAKGILQITDICRRDANRIVGFEKYLENDVFNARKSVEIWLIIQNKYNHNFNTFRGACRWISGRSYPKSDYAKHYILRVFNLINEA